LNLNPNNENNNIVDDNNNNVAHLHND
jgi:hypothetical protein